MDDVEMMQLKETVKGLDKGQRTMLYESRKKNVGLATALSVIIPGVGLMYIGKIARGIIVLLTFWTIVMYVLGIYWSYKESKRLNALLYSIIIAEPTAQ